MIVTSAVVRAALCSLIKQSPWLIVLMGVNGLRAAGAAESSNDSSSPDWIRCGLNTNRPVWGVRGGLLWGLPAGNTPRDGPRGLIRLWYPVLARSGYDLINFIAIEPVVRRHKSFSELEHSQLDGVQGKRLWAMDAQGPAESATNFLSGRLTRLASGGQTLALRVGVEVFENGAHVALTVSQRSDAADEIELVVHAQPDSAPLDYCILTATMGNKARTRQLWLKDEVVTSLKLYRDYKEPDFAPHQFFALDRLHRTPAGEVLAAITTDEANPAGVEPLPGRAHWRYSGFPVTQFWKKPAGAWREDLHVAVNGRYTYWLSRQSIPGGAAFENFEMRERFYDNQRFVFGITPKSPKELGFPSPR